MEKVWDSSTNKYKLEWSKKKFTGYYRRELHGLECK